MKSNGCTLLWAPPVDDGGSRLTSYIIEAREARRATWYQVDIVEASENQYKITDLVENNSYYFRVSAKNSIGVGDALESNPSVVIKRPPGAPDSPFPLLVTDIQVDSCTLEWKAPGWTGGEDLKGYTIERKLDDESEWKKLCEISPSCKSYTVQNLYEGTEYYFRISAFNSMGSSVPLELNRPVVPKRQLSEPSAPTGPITTLTTSRDSITIQWNQPKHNGGSYLTRYAIYCREVNTSNWARVGVVDPEVLSYQVENLTENSDYHFRVVAENKIGQSDYLQTTEPIKARSPYSVPNKPDGPLEVTNITQTSVTVSWKKPLSDGGSHVTGYVIKRRDVKRPVWVKCGRVNANMTSFKVKDLVEGCEYVVQIFAENIEGLSEPLESEPPVAPKRPLGPPEAPASFECIGVDVNQITLQWEAPLNDGGAAIKSYKLEMCDKGKWTTVSDHIDFLSTSYCVRNLVEGREYMFRIVATNEKGNCEPKCLDKPVRPRKKVEPPSQPAGPLTVTSIEDTSFTINWNSPATDGGSPITNYLIEIRDVIKANWTEIATVSSSVNTFKVTNLIENNDYFVRVKAQNEANLTSHALETESFVTVKSPFTVPTAPTGFKVVSVGKDKVTLEFKDSESDGNLGIRNYLIEKRDSKRVTWVKACKVRPQTKSENNESHTYTVEIDDLVAGGSYYFRVLAENQKGLSESNEIKVAVHLEKELETPSKPLDLNIVKQKRANAVMLEWKAPLYNGNDSISEYVLEQWNSLTNEWHVFHRSGPLENTYFVGHLEDGLSYRFRVSASNSQGQSEPSMETYEFTCQDMSAPSSPAGPLKYTISEDQYVINLEWSKPKQDGGSKIKRYIVERRQIGLTDWTKIGFTSGAETSYKITEYSIEESAYSFRVYAENECGMRSAPLELSQPIRIERRKQVPEPASYIRIKEKTADSITLTWKSFAVDSFSGADRFIIEKREKNSSVWTKAGQSLSETFTIENLDSNSSYYFRVIAVNAAGEGQAAEYHELVSMDISNEVPSMPLSMSFDEIAQDNVTLSWISPTNSGLKPIIGYKIYKLEGGGSSVWQLCGQIHRAKQLSYTITDLDYKVDYRFKVCAYSEMGIGKPNETAKIQMKKPIGKLKNSFI